MPSKASLFIALIACSTLFLKVLSQTISFEIDNFATSSANNIITFDRDAYVITGSQFVRLIRADPGASGGPARSSVGRVLYNNPITFWQKGKQMSFEVTLQFRILPVGNEPADGMTFFIVPVGSITSKGGEGNGLGIFGALTSNSSIFAIDFDIYPNRDQGEQYRQIGIDIGNRPSKNTTRLEDDVLTRVVTARINYEATTRRINVYLTSGSKTSEVSYLYDLKTYLPRQVQIGISASTGANVAFFDVSKWYFTGTLDADSSLEGTYLEQYV